MKRNAPCPCGSGARGKSCCGPVLDGTPAATPEALMRSRYTAYATGAVSHLIATTAPDGPHHVADTRAWRAELEAYCAAVRFVGLTVHEASADGDTGRVGFTARFVHDGEERSLSEHSRFVRRDGRWLYLDAG